MVNRAKRVSDTFTICGIVLSIVAMVDMLNAAGN